MKIIRRRKKRNRVTGVQQIAMGLERGNMDKEKHDPFTVLDLMVQKRVISWGKSRKLGIAMGYKQKKVQKKNEGAKIKQNHRRLKGRKI